MAGSIASTTARRRSLSLAVVLWLAAPAAAVADDPGGELVTITRQDAEPAEEEEVRSYTPIQLSFFPPGQIFSRARTVTGLALNGIYGEQWAVWGLDIGPLNDIGHDLRGLQGGVFNQLSDGSTGWGAQMGLGNLAMGDFNGLQTSLYNDIYEVGRGAQIGFVNQAGSLTGFQLGVVNTAETLRGLQIGFINVHSKGKVKFLPLFNFGF